MAVVAMRLGDVFMGFGRFSGPARPAVFCEVVIISCAAGREEITGAVAESPFDRRGDHAA
jgi:hypothetical protein